MSSPVPSLPPTSATFCAGVVNGLHYVYHAPLKLSEAEAKQLGRASKRAGRAAGEGGLSHAIAVQRI